MAVVLALLLLVHAALIARSVDHSLTKSPLSDAHPGASLWLWHAAMLAVLISLASSAVLLAHDLWEHVMLLLSGLDKPVLHLTYIGSRGEVPDAVNLVILLPMGLAVSAIALIARGLITQRRTQRPLRAMLSSATNAGEYYVIPAAAPLAFCLPGRRRCVVLTSAAHDLLTNPQRLAVLAHERAHHHHRHDLHMIVAHAVTSTLAPIRLLTNYQAEIKRLVELHADDRAAHQHTRRVVAQSLVLLSAPRRSHPTELGLAMAASDVGPRVERLLSLPPSPNRKGDLRRWMLMVVSALTVSPTMVAVPMLWAAARF